MSDAVEHSDIDLIAEVRRVAAELKEMMGKPVTIAVSKLYAPGRILQVEDDDGGYWLLADADLVALRLRLQREGMLTRRRPEDSLSPPNLLGVPIVDVDGDDERASDLYRRLALLLAAKLQAHLAPAEAQDPPTFTWSGFPPRLGWR